MIRASRATLLVCAAAAALAGCGSSSGSSTSASSVAAQTTPAASLKVTAKPKYGAPSPSAAVQAGVVQIAYRNIAINPDTLRVKVGSTIKWTNYDSVEHNVTSQGGPQQFASKDFGEGAGYEIKATRPGVIHYLCTIHPASMNGTIEVVR
jgi:plastocyanin